MFEYFTNILAIFEIIICRQELVAFLFDFLLICQGDRFRPIGILFMLAVVRIDHHFMF